MTSIPPLSQNIVCTLYKNLFHLSDNFPCPKSLFKHIRLISSYQGPKANDFLKVKIVGDEPKLLSRINVYLHYVPKQSFQRNISIPRWPHCPPLK